MRSCRCPRDSADPLAPAQPGAGLADSARRSAIELVSESAMSDVTSQVLELNSGASIPQVGLGVWQVRPGGTTRKTVSAALDAGYRHVDTARVYSNETDVGLAVRGGSLPREEIFVTTKLWNQDHGFDEALRAFDASLQRLGLEYIDLYLIHWP